MAASIDAETYDHWYDSPRGQWIGRREASLVLECLQPRPGESLLDVGCGTGNFTRALAAAVDGPVAGVDINRAWVDYARTRDTHGAAYSVADARALPYPDNRFDLVMSIAALCFVEDQAAALREIIRVTRRRFALGLLNRHSLLYWQKGRGGGRGGYRGARWHSAREARRLFRDLPVRDLRVQTAIQLPGGGALAQCIERTWPSRISSGGFMLVCGDITRT